jgi:hypothetical protein
VLLDRLVPQLRHPASVRGDDIETLWIDSDRVYR